MSLPYAQAGARGAACRELTVVLRGARDRGAEGALARDPTAVRRDAGPGSGALHQDRVTRARARALAEADVAALREQGLTGQRELAALERWLATRR